MIRVSVRQHPVLPGAFQIRAQREGGGGDRVRPVRPLAQDAVNLAQNSAVGMIGQTVSVETELAAKGDRVQRSSSG